VTAATDRENLAAARDTTASAIEDLIRRLLEDAEHGPPMHPGLGRAERVAHLNRRIAELAALRDALVAIDAGGRGDA